MRLDELLAELQTRLTAVLATRDRVHALLEAVVSVGSDLDLETVLRRIVKTATTLVDASYGALGVVGEEDTLLQFIPVGLTEEEIARIEHWPHGLGLLGLLIKDARPLRLGRISDHPESYGFPPGHPPMGTFLGRSRTRARRGVQASSDLTTSLLSGADPHEVLATMAARARQMCDADLVQVLLPEMSGGSLRVEVADGEGADELLGTTFDIACTLAGDAFTQGEPLSETDLQSVADLDSPLRRLGYGPALLVPVGAVPRVRGVLTLTKRSGRLTFSREEQQMFKAFAGQAAIALELAEARRDAERLGLLEDRDRIAKDLHDVVIQRLFATAMTLMSTVRLVERPEASKRLQHAIDELDETIRQIRSSIFALQGAREESAPGLRARIVGLVEGAGGQLGFMPGLRMEGQIDTLVGEQVAEHLLAVLREALSNVVRHSRATRAEVSIEVADRRLILMIADNGVGVGQGGRRSGLRNIEERAARLGGTAELESSESGGTRLSWRVPL
ncbi:sensor histidine kinase [Nonomuraea monospora]